MGLSSTRPHLYQDTQEGVTSTTSCLEDLSLLKKSLSEGSVTQNRPKTLKKQSNTLRKWGFRAPVVAFVRGFSRLRDLLELQAPDLSSGGEYRQRNGNTAAPMTTPAHSTSAHSATAPIRLAPSSISPLSVTAILKKSSIRDCDTLNSAVC